MAVATSEMGPVSPAQRPITRRRAFRRWRRRNIVHPLQAMILRVVVAGLGCLPIDWVSAVGCCCFRAAAPFARGRIRRTAQNLRAIHSSLTPQQARDRALAAWCDVGRTFVEAVVLHRMWQSGRVAVVGAAAARGTVRQTRPIIFVGGHLGNWEIGPVGAIGAGYSMSALYRAPGNPGLDRLIRSMRQRFGLTLIAKSRTGGTRTAFEAVVAADCLGVLVDEKTVQGVQAPSAGRPVGAAVRFVDSLARRTEAPVILGSVVRTGGARFDLIVEPIGSADRPAIVAQAVDAWLMRAIRRRPEQWLWLADAGPEIIRALGADTSRPC